MIILLTGATGYIGAHVAKELHARGHSVYGLDKNTNQNNIDKYCTAVINCDLNTNKLEDSWKWDAIIHLAAYISVEESVADPLKYYSNNINSTVNLLSLETDHFLFASTGSAFDAQNPYSRSKIMCEEIIRSKCPNHTIFRFFNVSGIDPEFSPTGNPTHLIRRLAMLATGKLDEFTVYGTDFPTPDGTCVRDYIHVIDLANAICNALDAGPMNTEYECLGSGTGYSVHEVVAAMEIATGLKLDVKYGPRRLGDAPIITTPWVSELLNPKYSLVDMCKSAYQQVLTK